MSQPPDPALYRSLLRQFLDEDVGAGDITSESIVPQDCLAAGRFTAKAPLVLAGLEIAFEVFRLLDPRVSTTARQRDGDSLSAGDEPGEVRGPARVLLAGERVALNVLQRLSGVATLTRQYVDVVRGTNAIILDTRKTTPGLRLLEKYAVTAGGGHNHRSGLYDAVLIKDNHIRLAGSVLAAIAAARASRQEARFVEVEVSNTVELGEAIAAAPDIILLDNMTPEELAEAVRLARRQSSSILLEASGGITLANVRRYAATGVDRISIGAITHSAPAVDISLEIEPLNA